VNSVVYSCFKLLYCARYTQADLHT